MATRRDIVIRPDDSKVIHYLLKTGIKPCRADMVIKDSWWTVTKMSYGSNRQPQDVLIFLDSKTGHIPQHSVDDMVIHLMKRILFPWADLVKLPEVYLVRHKQKGWQVPYGMIR